MICEVEMAPKNGSSRPTPVTALPEYATVLAQCMAQRGGGHPALVAATDRYVQGGFLRQIRNCDFYDMERLVS